MRRIAPVNAKMDTFRFPSQHSSLSLPVNLVYSTSGRVIKWLSPRELRQMGAGLVPGVTRLDVTAAVEGQAEARMRGYAKRVMWWEAEDGKGK